MIEQHRLEVASKSRWARELMGELAGIKQTITGFGRTKFEPDGSRAHDDLVLALALAWCWVRKQGSRSCWGEQREIVLWVRMRSAFNQREIWRVRSRSADNAGGKAAG